MRRRKITQATSSFNPNVSPIEKKKEKSKKTWEDRKNSVEVSKKKAQEKRAKNIEARKLKKKE